MAWSVALALTVTWTGMGVAYYSPYPIGFWITSLAFGLFVVARLGRGLVDRAGVPGRRGHQVVGSPR